MLTESPPANDPLVQDHERAELLKFASSISVLMICPELPSADNPGSMAPGARQIESIQNLGIKTHVVDMRGVPKFKYLQVIPRIRKLAAQVDLIHSHFGYCGWLGRLAPAFSGKRPPLVISYMGDDLLGSPINEKGDLERISRMIANYNIRFARKADAVITKSREMANLLSVPVSVIPNCVDTDIFKPIPRTSACQDLGVTAVNAKKTRVLFAGNPENPRKRFGLASKATEIAGQILGSELDLVPMWGVAPDQVPVLMNSCDAMLMTSYIEGSPNVVKEAMACDLPVVGVKVGDVHELLDGVACCRRTDDTPEQIGKGLSEVLQTNHTERFGRDSVFSKGLTLDNAALRIARVYRSVLNPAGRS